ncbi:MAG: CPBP family intramembrane metalloprotease [Deltaproteobacteria bacterium]|nr:CPBP family intramembrane metalloprotease [Deltaproteobacteria bacterium]
MSEKIPKDHDVSLAEGDAPGTGRAASGQERVTSVRELAASGDPLFDEGFPVAPLTIVLIVIYHLAATTVTHFHKVAGAGAIVFGLVLFHRPLGRLLNRYLVESWRVLNREAAETRALAGEGPGTFDYRVLVVLGVAAVMLTMMEYFGGRNTYHAFVSRHWPVFTKHHYYNLSQFIYWSLFRVVTYVLIPWVVVLFMPGERIRDYGMSPKGVFSHLWIYGVLYAIIAPVLVMVSFTRPFQRTYPFYKLAPRSWLDFGIWEAFYSVQFFALEVFFRGFMIHPLKRALGSYAIFVMAVPYCMIHYNKPLAEVLGAILAGTILGTLSLRTRSIWCGVLIHVSVALSMDILSLVQTAGWPGNPRWIG